MKTDVQSIELLLEHLSSLWESGQPCVDLDGVPISDGEYDAIVRELRLVKPDSEVLVRIAPSLEDYSFGGDLVKHDPPMTSISKADGPMKMEILKDWLSKYANPSGFAVSHKLDGVAARVYYENGKLVKAGLRPRDGVMGVDISKNIRFIAGVPSELPEPITVAFGGEIVCKLSDFQKVQEELSEVGLEQRKNPRNHACGAVNQKLDPSKTKAGRLTFIPYNISCSDSPDIDESYMPGWIDRVLHMQHVKVHMCATVEDVLNLIPVLEEETKTLDFETDGLVIKINNIELQKSFGHVGDNPTDCPRGAIAWKYDEEAKVTTVEHIEWNTSRTGKLFPVAILSPPVELAGTIVSRVSCCNYGWMADMNIGIGSRVHVIKAGKIIPKIVLSENGGDPNLPPNCSCGGDLEVVENDKTGAKYVQCTNAACDSLILDRHLHFFSSIGAKGVGEFALTTIKGTTKVGDYYRKTIDELIRDGLTMRQSLLFMAAIRLVKPVDDNVELERRIMVSKPKIEKWLLLRAIGIASLGSKAAKSLMVKYDTYENLSKQSVEEITKTDGIATKTATSIISGLTVLYNELEDVSQFFTFGETSKVTSSSKLSGKSFVLSGTLEGGKAKWEKLIVENGGTIGSGVTKTTNYLVAGPGSGSKTEKAQKYGVVVITTDDIVNMTNE